MNIIKYGIDVILHLDSYMNLIIQHFGAGTYLILFLIVFCETGLVVTPFLPGDSLLFASGAFAALGFLDIKLLLLINGLAAVLGDTANYTLGRTIGRRIYEKENLRFIKREHLIKTHKFYEKHGAATIIIARFIPIIRTFAPFVAGIGEMKYTRFISYNIVGGLAWVILFTLGGYYFGNLPAVKHNFTFVIFGIIFISVIPAVLGLLKEKIKQREDRREERI
ncbi:DedA family protein [Lacrimispora sphenoides]|uniref:Membrane-associated protein n=1 Tax=Lacrimispora sphenoides JCM 1415 TaxID=1297793 RepID=A0ABY1CFF4_9FIRM|nr:DedA family protein [Lacrimispora sphenoides]SEU00284.1 membrane-associated protein [[Clostridium] sphenoides JCM 1415]SUY53133.1 putative membrane-associated protein [Lacrimispora sphenoides]